MDDIQQTNLQALKGLAYDKLVELNAMQVAYQSKQSEIREINQQIMKLKELNGQPNPTVHEGNGTSNEPDDDISG